MKYKIYYTIGEYEDYYILDGETIEDIQKQNDIEMKKRGLDCEKNNCYSEKLRS